MPEDNRDVKFGVTEKDRGHELNSCVKLYFLPFRDAWRVLSRKSSASAPAVSDPDDGQTGQNSNAGAVGSGS
jgi:hypothetical protein